MNVNKMFDDLISGGAAGSTYFWRTHEKKKKLKSTIFSALG